MSQSPANEATVLTVAPARAFDLGRRWSMIVLGVVCLAFLPLVYWHVTWMWGRDEYQYIPLLPLGSAFLAWQRWDEIGTLRPGSTWKFLSLTLLVLFLMTLAIAVAAPWLGAVAFLFMLGTAIYGYGGWHLFKLMLPAWLLLWLAIPLPLGLDLTLIYSLQSLTAHWASQLLNWIGILHVTTGNVIDVPGHRLFVEEACAGIHSLYAILSVTVFYVLWTRMHWFRAIFLITAAVGWVLAANALRVLLITLAVENGHDSVAQADTWQHEMVGILVFVFALTMIVSTDRLLMFFLPMRSGSDLDIRHGSEAARRTFRWPALSSTWLGSRVSIPVMAAFGLLAVFQVALIAGGATDRSEKNLRVEQQFDHVDQKMMPAQWGSEEPGKWTFSEFGTSSRVKTDAKFSRYWVYKQGDATAYLSIDFPFYGWHDLIDCYAAQGWTDEGRVTHDATDNAEKIPYVELELSHSKLRHGHLLFFLFNRFGEPMPNRYDLFSKAVGRLTSVQDNWRLFQSSVDGNSSDPAGFQVQLFVDSYTPLDEKQRADALAFFLKATEEFRKIRPRGEAAL